MKKVSIINRYLSFIKSSAWDPNTPKSLDEALSLLEINPSEQLSVSLIKEKKNKAALKHHPDHGGSHEMMLKINSAVDYLLNFLNKKSLEQDSSEYLNEDLSYEDIAEMRREMGREEFERKFPGWVSEIKHEIGLDEYNRLFEGYDSNYNPYDDESYQRSQEELWEYAYNIIDDSVDLSGLMDKAEEISPEELKWLLNQNFSDAESALKDLGAVITTDLDIDANNLKNLLSEKDLNKIKNEVLNKRLKTIYKNYKSLSLKDLIADSNLFFIFSPEKHLTEDQVSSVITDDFINFIINDRKSYFSNFSPALSAKNDISKLSLSRKANLLGRLLAEFLKSRGAKTYSSMIFDSIFTALAEQDYLKFKNLVNLANPANYIKKEARKRFDDPAQEKLREAKDKWNSETTELIKKLISFKRGINGRGDKSANLPTSSIKDPLPPEVGNYWNEVASSAAKVIEHAKFIINEQESYSKNRRKSSEQELELIKLANMLAEASWWGSRFFAKFPLFFKLSKDQREVVTNLIYDYVDLSDNLKKFEEQILMPNKSGVGQAFTTANIIINNFSDIIEKNLRKLKLFAVEEEQKDLPFSDKESNIPESKQQSESLEEEKKSRDVLHSEAISKQKKIMEDITTYKEDVLQYLSNTEIFSASSDLKSKVNEINNNLDRLKRKFDSEKFEKTGPSFIQAVATLENSYKELLFLIKKFIFLKYKGEDLDKEPEAKLLKDIGNFSSFEEIFINLMPQIQFSTLQSQASLKTWIREKLLGLSSDSFTRKQVELSKESKNIRKQINDILNRLENPNSSIKSILIDSLHLKQMISSWSEEVLKLGETYTLLLRRSDKEKESYKYDIKREDLTRMLKSKQEL